MSQVPLSSREVSGSALRGSCAWDLIVALFQILLNHFGQVSNPVELSTQIS